MKNHLPARTAFPIFATFFFFSGAAGLIYEVLWMRRFGHVMGNTTVSLSAVLTAFMGGLAIGSWIGGRIADRRYDHLRLYGLLEALIGLYALFMPTLIAALTPILAGLYRAEPRSLSYLALPYVRFLLALAIMIVPTTFMGATLPILIKYFTTRREEVGERVGYIYGINTVGAMFGAFLAGFFLIPGLGMRLTNLSAAAINLTVGVLALLIGGPNRPARPSSAAAPQAPPTPPAEQDEAFAQASPVAVKVALLGIGLSGIAAMIYQVCWTRMWALLIGSSTYAFSLVVLVNIGGLALGGVMFGRWIDRSRRPMLFLATLQLLVGASAFVIAYFSKQYPVWILRLLAQHLGSYDAILFNEFCTVAFLLIIPTFLMGGMFPVVARVCAKRVSELGTTVGTVYAVNTVGAVIGSFSAALILMNWFGIGPTMLIAVGLNLFVAFTAALSETRPPAALRLGVAVLALLAGAAMAIQPPRWERAVMSSAPFMSERFDLRNETRSERFVERAHAADLVFYKDGTACTVSVRRATGPFGGISLAVNGKVEASDSMGDMPTQLLCGHLGLLLRPDAKEAMVIGLGGGVSLASVLKHDSIKRVDMVEIASAVVEAVKARFADVNDHALDDPRVNLIIADGRNHVTLTDRTYDLIVNVPSNPWMAGISNLFTSEFFHMCASRLNPDGVMVQWIHTYNLDFADYMMVIKTFMEAMDYATLWETTEGDYLMVGSKKPIIQNWDQLKARVEEPKIKEHLDKARLGNVWVFITDYMASKEDLIQTAEYQNAPCNVDDTCRLEWSAPRAYYELARSVSPDQVVAMRRSPAGLFDPQSLAPQVRNQLDQIPVARKLAIQGVSKRFLGELGLSSTDLEDALLLNPYDVVIRGHAIDTFGDLGAQSLAQSDFAACRDWLKRAVETYEAIGFSQDPLGLARIYRQYQVISEYLEDTAAAEKARQKILEFGGPELADQLSKIRLTSKKTAKVQPPTD